MDELAKVNREERQIVFSEAAIRKGIPPVVVEKDFWICWLLQKLFESSDSDHPVTIEGGTPLSKVYHAIDRFSENIDLAFDCRSFGFDDEAFSRAGNEERKRQMKALEQNCIRFLINKFKPELEKTCSELLEAGSWSIELIIGNSHILLFRYPICLSWGDYHSLDHIRPSITLELKSKSGSESGIQADISPYIKDYASDSFGNPNATVIALTGSRIFWEKLAVLHAEYYRPQTLPRPERLSRHYYDAVMLDQNIIGRNAIKDTALLESVAQHRYALSRSSWAHYDLARPGTVHLAPHDDLYEWLQKDYRHVQELIFENAPSFEQITQELNEMENIINRM